MGNQAKIPVQSSCVYERGEGSRRCSNSKTFQCIDMHVQDFSVYRHACTYLKRVEELHHIWAVYLCQHVPLRLDMRYLARAKQVDSK
jgi:hypothetical protein